MLFVMLSWGGRVATDTRTMCELRLPSESAPPCHIVTWSLGITSCVSHNKITKIRICRKDVRVFYVQMIHDLNLKDRVIKNIVLIVN